MDHRSGFFILVIYRGISQLAMEQNQPQNPGLALDHTVCLISPAGLPPVDLDLNFDYRKGAASNIEWRIP